MISTIQVEGMKDVIKGINNLQAELSNPTQPLNDSGIYMQDEAFRNFSARGNIMQGSEWKPLTKTTEKIKKAKGFGGQPIMVRKGDLRKSFKKSNPQISSNISSIKVFNPVSYAADHQYGVGKLPRRVLLKFQANHIKKITEIFKGWIIKSTQTSFR